MSARRIRMTNGLVVQGKGVGVLPKSLPRAMHQAYAAEFGDQMAGLMGSRRRVGATNPNFAVPSGLDATTAGSGLLNAVNNLLTAYSSSGVPSEHSYDSNAAAVQTAWNADPMVTGAGTNAQLQVDGGYGPNTATAVAAVNGGSAPSVNTAPASSTPVPVSPSPPLPAPSSSTTTSTTSIFGLTGWQAAIVGVAAAGGAVLVARSVAKKHGHTIAHHARRLAHHARHLHHASEGMTRGR